jgi:Holliday junction resolvase RusA-like endonuclease
MASATEALDITNKIMGSENIKQTYLITIDIPTMKKYETYYFKKYPKRKVFPFASRKTGVINPIPPSLNQWMIMKRPQMNNVKQQWTEFIVWLIDYHSMTNQKINRAKITFTYYFKDKRRRDADNYTPKNLMDGFTESGLIIDDNFEHIEMLCIKGGYDKNNPRVEILIEEV